jgi:hypothetical protein
MAAQRGNKQARVEALALALARGHDVKGAAREVGISERCAHNYRQEPGFADLVQRLKGELFADAVAVPAGGARFASGQLLDLTRSGTEQVRLQPSKGVLLVGHAFRKDDDFERRLQQLEAERQRKPGGAPL